MSKLSRRRFIGNAAAAAGLAAVLDGTALGQVSRGLTDVRGADGLSVLGWDSFLPFVNTDFRFYAGRRRGRSMPLRLVEMRDSRPLPTRARRLLQENFVMKFTSAQPLPLANGTYSVSHFNLGDFDLFVTEGDRDGGLNTYIAVINRVTVPEMM